MVKTSTRLAAVACMAVPFLFMAIALMDVLGTWIYFIGVIMFSTAYTVLDVIGHPVRPVPGAWLRKRITINLGYMATVALVVLAFSEIVKG